MNEKEIVKLFLENGFQLSNSALSLVKENPDKIIYELKKTRPRPFIVTEKHIKKIIKKPEKEKKIKSQIKILKEFHTLKKPVRVEDYTKHFLSRYEKIREILSKNTTFERLISINKITLKTENFSIIGLVREKKINNLLVEDPTGEIHVFFEENMKSRFDEIFLDDIIGLKCKENNEKQYVNSVIFPDVPLSREVHKTENEMKIIVISNPPDLDDKIYQKLIDVVNNIKNLSSIFIFWDEATKNLEELSKFNLINISKTFNPTIFQMNSINTLVIHKHFFNNFGYKINKDTLTHILKRRHILPTFHLKIHMNEDDLVLENIPDIIISNLDESFYKNYKGTTIVSNVDARKVFILDLKTRETIEKSL